MKIVQKIRPRTLNYKEMNYKMIGRTLLGMALLTAVSAKAQQAASELQMSTEDATYWYRICNATEGMQDYVMTDCHFEKSYYNVQLLKTEQSNELSQWKLTEGEDGKVVLTNRSTGMQLSSTSVNVGNHNATQLTDNGGQGYTITPLGNDAFRLESVEDDGVNRCLAMAKQQSDAIAYPTDDESASVVGWKFMLTETIVTGIGATEKGKTAIRVANKRVSVSGCPEWQLFNSLGEEMPRTTPLATGIYLVKTPTRVVKVLVQ